MSEDVMEYRERMKGIPEHQKEYGNRRSDIGQPNLINARKLCVYLEKILNKDDFKKVKEWMWKQ